MERCKTWCGTWIEGSQVNDVELIAWPPLLYAGFPSWGSLLDGSIHPNWNLPMGLERSSVIDQVRAGTDTLFRRHGTFVLELSISLRMPCRSRRDRPLNLASQDGRSGLRINSGPVSTSLRSNAKEQSVASTHRHVSNRNPGRLNTTRVMSYVTSGSLNDLFPIRSSVERSFRSLDPEPGLQILLQYLIK